MKKLSILLIISCFLSSHFLSAEEVSESETVSSSSIEEKGSFAVNSVKIESTDGFLHENDGKKHWFTAVGGMLFFNVGLSSYNRFVTKSDWAQVGSNEWNRFWERTLEYDRDWYWTNFVLHPYQGSIYYMVSRGSNLTFYESFGVTLLGSAFWEYLCETNAPSINDMYYTSVGSFAVGEMLYRLSLNADELSEILGYFVNPTRCWTQLWTRQNPQGTTRNIHELSLAFGLGAGATYSNIINNPGISYPESEKYPVIFTPAISIVYNDPYGHDSNEPYSQFEMDISASVGKSSGEASDCQFTDLEKKIMYDIRILSNGMLFARAPQLSENTDTTIGMVLEYEFDWHHFYELSSLGPGLAIKQRLRLNEANFEWQLHGACNILGTTDYYYYRRPIVQRISNSGRNYNYTLGPMAIFKARYKTENGTALNFNFRGYGMYNFYGQLQDDLPNTSAGWEWIGIANLSFELPVSKIVRLGISDELYVKRAFYKSMPDVFQILNSASVFAKFQMK